jgi:hypothetical protein
MRNSISMSRRVVPEWWSAKNKGFFCLHNEKVGHIMETITHRDKKNNNMQQPKN